MNLTKISITALVTAAMSGCGFIATSLPNNDTDLREKAAFSLNAAVDEITIIAKKAHIDKVTFDVELRGNYYSCYHTTAIAVSSDAICQETNKEVIETKKTQNNCNALLKAAGKCN